LQQKQIRLTALCHEDCGIVGQEAAGLRDKESGRGKTTPAHHAERVTRDGFNAEASGNQGKQQVFSACAGVAGSCRYCRMRRHG
jgi:hypothetical protein